MKMPQMQVMDKQCASCAHSEVCRHKEEYEKAASQASYTDAVGPFTLLVKCSFYKPNGVNLRASAPGFGG
jgi:hypothetical protein